MEISIQSQQVCKIHQLELEYVNPFYPNDKLLCHLCIDKIKTQTSIKSNKKKTIENIRQQYQNNLNTFEYIIDSVKQFKESLIEGITIIENIIVGIGTQIQNTKQQIQLLQQKPLQQMNIRKSHEKYLKEERNFFQNVTEFLEMIKFDKNISELIQKLDELDFQSFGQQNLQQSIRVENIVKQPNLDQHSFEIKQEDIKMYEYELLPQSTIKLWGEHCYTMDINNDVSKVAVGCYHNIKIFDLQNDQLSNSQILKGHVEKVTSIQFFKHRNQFISTGNDKIINLWQLNNKNEWVIIQNLNSGNRGYSIKSYQRMNNILEYRSRNIQNASRRLKTTSFHSDQQGHLDAINCLIINQNEDMILTGSKDKTIISWILSDDLWIFDQCLECQSQVWCLSLNESNTKLISCEENKIIRIFEIKNNQWILKQNIQFESQGLRLSFLGDSEFTFQPQKSQYLLFYKFNYIIQKFEINYQVEVNTGNIDESGFPISFIKSKNILIVKNCQYLNVLNQQMDGRFNLNYSIQFNSHNFYGCTSADGEYLITRDSQAIQYQIRKLKERK